MLKKQAQRLNM